MVQFKRAGLKSYRAYFKTKQEADADCKAFNDKLFREGRDGQHIGPVERRQLLLLMDALRAKKRTIKDAIRIIEDLPEPEKHIECKQALADFLAAKDSAGRSYDTQLGLKNRISAFFTACGKTHIDQIDEFDLRQYIFRPGSSYNQRNDRAALGNFYNYLVKRGYLEKSPINKIDTPSRPRHESVAILRPGETQIWFWRLEEKYPKLVSYYALALFAGLRPSEILHLSPSDLTANGIKVTGGKMRGRKRRIVPRTPVLNRWLEHYPPSFDWPPVDSRMQTGARKLCPRPWKTDLPRHTYISTQLALTNDEKLVASWAGNSPDVIYSSYFETMRKEKATLLDQIRPKP